MVKWLRSTSGLRVGWMIITGWLRSWSNPGVWWEPCSHSAHDVCSHQKISHYWLDPQLWLDMFGIYSYLILLHDLTKDTSVRFLYISPVLSQWDRWDIFPTHGMQKNDHIFCNISHKYSINIPISINLAVFASGSAPRDLLRRQGLGCSGAASERSKISKESVVQISSSYMGYSWIL